VSVAKIPENNCGVYIIENKITGDAYIGSSQQLKRRWTVHRCELKAGRHHNPHLQNAYDCYGLDAFIFKVLIPCIPRTLNCNEQFAIDLLKPVYNVVSIPVARTPEIIEKIKSGRKGIKLGPQSKEHRMKIAAGRRGKKHSDETRRKISEAARGRKMSKETRNKISKSLKGNIPWNKGVPATDEHKRNVSRGVRRALETTDLREKLSEAQRGRKHSEETRRKMSESAKAAWVIRKQRINEE